MKVFTHYGNHLNDSKKISNTKKDALTKIKNFQEPLKAVTYL